MYIHIQLLIISAFTSVIVTLVIIMTFHGHVVRRKLLKLASKKRTKIAWDYITDNFQCLLPMRSLNVIMVRKAEECFLNALKLFLQIQPMIMMMNFPLWKSSTMNWTNCWKIIEEGWTQELLVFFKNLRCCIFPRYKHRLKLVFRTVNSLTCAIIFVWPQQKKKECNLCNMSSLDLLHLSSSTWLRTKNIAFPSIFDLKCHSFFMQITDSLIKSRWKLLLKVYFGLSF